MSPTTSRATTMVMPPCPGQCQHVSPPLPLAWCWVLACCPQAEVTMGVPGLGVGPPPTWGWGPSPPTAVAQAGGPRVPHSGGVSDMEIKGLAEGHWLRGSVSGEGQHVGTPLGTVTPALQQQGGVGVPGTALGRGDGSWILPVPPFHPTPLHRGLRPGVWDKEETTTWGLQGHPDCPAGVPHGTRSCGCQLPPAPAPCSSAATMFRFRG